MKYIIYLMIIMFVSCSNAENEQKNNLSLNEADSLFKITFYNNNLEGTGELLNGFLSDNWIYKYNEDEFKLDWKIYTDKTNSFKISFPKQWEINNQENALFCVMPNSKDVSEYSIFVLHKLEDIGVNLNDFLKTAINLYMVDLNSPVLSYDIQELIYNDKKVYELDVIVLNAGKKSLIKNIYFNDEKYLYDFSNKLSLEKNNQQKHTIFIEMIKSFELDNNKILGNKSTFKTIRHFKIEDI